MLGPSRPVPRVGARARITHFGGYAEVGMVVAVTDGGRRLRVRAQSGESLEFVLSPATARFVAAGVAHGPRLELLEPARLERAASGRARPRSTALHGATSGKFSAQCARITSLIHARSSCVATR